MANLEVGYLLQRFECFDGLVVVATDRPDDLKPAVLARSDVAVAFAKPAELKRDDD